MRGFVHLVGAGPGNAGLISMTGLKYLKQADVVVYDYLAAASLLNETKPSAELIYAGKHAGNHHMKQDAIIDLLIEKARAGYEVVRLKGGDTFIFGRGGEEMAALKAAGIACDAVSGISSAYAVPAYAGIPVTHRNAASSFHVITGHEDPMKGENVLDYQTLAAEEGTLVFLMGLTQLEAISRRLITAGKAAATPAAVISHGISAAQRVVTGTLSNISEAVRQAALTPPAIIVVGDVVNLRPQVMNMSGGRLSGKKVLITASRPLADVFSRQVTDEGGEAAALSLVRTVPCDSGMYTQITASVLEVDWLVLTSSNGVRILFDIFHQTGMDIRKLSHVRFAVIGAGTAKTLAEKGIYADIIPDEHCSSALGAVMAEQVKPYENVLLLRAKEASEELPEILTKAHIVYQELPLYHVEKDSRKQEALLMELPSADYVTFASASAVHAFMAMTDEKTRNGMCAEIICIGPVTAQAAQKAGLTVDGTAKAYTTAGMTECIADMALRQAAQTESHNSEGNE